MSTSAFFRAMIVAVSEEDPYAGVLASMHAVGIYSHRYGTDPALTMTRAGADQELVDQFIAERNAEHARLLNVLGISTESAWRDYLRVQVFDRLCLYFCLNDLEAGTDATLSPAPVDDGDTDTTLNIRPVAPWEIAIDPYPFDRPALLVELPRRLMPHQTWPSRPAFAAAHAATPVERVPITIHPGS